MKKKKYAYIVGPYRGKTFEETEKNIQKAAGYARKWWTLGYIVICPHTNSAHFSGCCPERFFLEGYRDILTRGIIDVVIATPGWEESEGSLAELKIAKKQNIPINYEEEIRLTGTVYFNTSRNVKI